MMTTTIVSTDFSRTVRHYIRLVIFTAEHATAGYTSEASTSQHSRQQLTIILSVLVGPCRRNIISTRRTARRAAEASCHFRRAWWNFSSLQPISNEQPRQLGLADRAQPSPSSDRLRAMNWNTDELIELSARQIRESIISQHQSDNRLQISIRYIAFLNNRGS